MKKLLVVIGLLVTVATVSSAAGIAVQSFVNPQIYSFCVTNTLGGVTNLWTLPAAARTNCCAPGMSKAGLASYTNNAPYLYQVTNWIAGPQVVIVGPNSGDGAKIGWNTNGPAGPLYTTNSTVNILGSVALPYVPATFGASSNIVGSIVIKAVSLAANAGTNYFVFKTMPTADADQNTLDGKGMPITTTGAYALGMTAAAPNDGIVVPVIMNGQTPVVARCPVPALWVSGAKRLTCAAIYCDTADANSYNHLTWIDGIWFVSAEP